MKQHVNHRHEKPFRAFPERSRNAAKSGNRVPKPTRAPKGPGLGTRTPAPTQPTPKNHPLVPNPNHTTIYACHTMTTRPPQRQPRPTQRRGSTRAERVIRTHVLDRDNWHCRHCGRRIHNRTDCPQGGCRDDAHVDHIIHWRDGGPTTPDNLIASCRHCNLTRSVGDRPRARPGTTHTRLMHGVQVL